MNNASESPEIVAEFIGSIPVIRFNQPARRSPLSSNTLATLDEIFSDLGSRPDVSAIIFTGTDDVFASGADIRELARLDQTAASAFSKRGQRLFRKIADARQLTVAAINGYCMGGALDLSLACRVRVASKDAVFAHPGSLLGIITGWGGTQRLPRLIGRSQALELFMTARRISAIEALRLGLISSIGDPVLDTALEIVREKQMEVTALPATSNAKIPTVS